MRYEAASEIVKGTVCLSAASVWQLHLYLQNLPDLNAARLQANKLRGALNALRQNNAILPISYEYLVYADTELRHSFDYQDARGNWKHASDVDKVMWATAIKGAYGHPLTLIDYELKGAHRELEKHFDLQLYRVNLWQAPRYGSARG